MSNYWAWNGAYVRSKSQDEVAAAIKGALRSLTDDLYELTDEVPSGLNHHAQKGGAFAFISSYKKGWTAFWTNGVFSRWVFQAQALSGVLVDGRDADGTVDFYAQGYRDTWSLSVYENGVHAEWFVNDPIAYFADAEFYWGPVATENFLMPFLAQKLGEFEASRLGSGLSARELVSGREDLFLLEPQRLRAVLKPSVSVEQVRDWGRLHAGKALYDMHEVVDIPFVGPRFYWGELVNYFDLLRHMSNPYAHINLHPHISAPGLGNDLDERSDEWKETVAAFKVLYGGVPDTLDIKYAHLFSIMI